MSASIFTTRFQSDAGAGFPLTDLSPSEGVFSPASGIAPVDATRQPLPAAGVARAAVRVEDIYINSDVIHDLALFYRPDSVIALPSGPSSANNDTLIYSYVGRTNNNPLQEDDDAGRRLKKLVFGQRTSVITPPFGGGGTLQFQVPPFAGIIKVTVQWSLITPGGGIGT